MPRTHSALFFYFAACRACCEVDALQTSNLTKFIFFVCVPNLLPHTKSRRRQNVVKDFIIGLPLFRYTHTHSHTHTHTHQKKRTESKGERVRINQRRFFDKKKTGRKGVWSPNRRRRSRRKQRKKRRRKKRTRTLLHHPEWTKRRFKKQSPRCVCT